MKPKFKLLEKKLIDQIISEGLEILMNPGVKVHNDETLKLLADHGAEIDLDEKIAHIPEELVLKAIDTAPSEFSLYTLDGEPAVRYMDDEVHFNPCSTALTIVDSETQKQRPPVSEDMVKFVKLVETLPQLDAQSTSLVCSDVPKEVADIYRLYIALNLMRKPIVTGAFRSDTLLIMKDLLVAAVGDESTLSEKPIAIFDVCPSPPLLWSDLGCQNLLDCARADLPVQFISMPLTGATAPITLTGALVQHAAETMSGVTIAQLAKKGAPVVWGGSPSALDMRTGNTPMGAVETWMIDIAYVEVGKELNLPTNAYMGLSDAKVVDTQCGLEAAGGILLASLAGVNMVSSPGMLDFESSQSFEKVVIDSEIIAMGKRLVQGIEARENPIATTIMAEMGHRSDYLTLPHTHKWFKEELHIPSKLVDRSSVEEWEREGSKSMFERARDRVNQLVDSYEPSPISSDVRTELNEITSKAAKKFGMDKLPDISFD